MGHPEDGTLYIPLNAPAGGGGPGRFRIPQPLDASELPGGEGARSSLDSMRFTRTIIEVEVSTVFPWTGPLMVGAEFYYRKNLDALQEAVQKAIRYAPTAIEAETGQAIQEFVGSILDTLIMSAVIVGASSALGAAIGGVIGFFFGGAGALPGVALGAEVGFDVGMFLLEWLGLAFLLEHVARKLGEVAFLVGPNVKLAWEAAGKPSLQRAALIDSAGRGLARAIGVMFRLILEAIVLFLLAKGTAKLGELTGKLKASKLGKGFGEWVERNWQKLVDDPRYNPRLRPKSAAGQKPSWRSKQSVLGQSDGGPGEWVESPRRTKGVEYQEQVSGVEQGAEYEVNGVKFDGYDAQRKVLLDAKEWPNLLKNSDPPGSLNAKWPVKDSILKEATRQTAATDVPIEWQISDQTTADSIRQLFEQRDIPIDVVYTPKN